MFGVDTALWIALAAAALGVVAKVWPTETKKAKKAVKKVTDTIDQVRPILDVLKELSRADFNALEGEKRIAGKKLTKQELDAELRRRVRSKSAIYGIPWQAEYDVAVSGWAETWSGVDKLIRAGGTAVAQVE